MTQDPVAVVVHAPNGWVSPAPTGTLCGLRFVGDADRGWQVHRWEVVTEIDELRDVTCTTCLFLMSA